MSDRDGFGPFFVGFLIGGLSAAVVTLLYAPQSGEETRTLIKDKSIELRDKAQATTQEALARAEEAASNAATAARNRADEMSRQLREGKKSVESIPSPLKPTDQSGGGSLAV